MRKKEERPANEALTSGRDQLTVIAYVEERRRPADYDDEGGGGTGISSWGGECVTREGREIVVLGRRREH